MLSDPFDVLVIGGGAAGLYAALCLPSHLQVGILTKEPLSLSASGWAQGGIAAAIAPEDSVSLHLEDTLRAGAGLCDWDAVNLLVEQASDCVRSLVELGVAFDRDRDALALTLEAAHSRRRVLHAADTTGQAVITTLTTHVLNRPNIRVFPQTFALDLWMEASRCVGVSLVAQGTVSWLRATVVVLATGGGGQVFAQTTNPEVSTGDGVAMAWRVGAQLRDLEFFQFHPTALTQPGAPRFLISEAVRGEGAHLIDQDGRRFAFDYHPKGELAPRDVVSRAIFNHLQKTTIDSAAAHVWLDLRPIPVEHIHHRFPNIIQVCKQWGIDVFQTPIPVAPAAHYWMGGITTDLFSQSSLPGLYAVGETASTGVHGANRLASNSLLECLVFGAQLGKLTLSADQRPSVQTLQGEPVEMVVTDWQQQQQQQRLIGLRQELTQLVWHSAGICREGQSLETAIALVEQWQVEFDHLPLSQVLQVLRPGQTAHCANAEMEPLIRRWGETRNLLTIADLILKSAVFRTESRGGHYRSDYPDSDPDWQVHTLVQERQWWRSPLLESLT